MKFLLISKSLDSRESPSTDPKTLDKIEVDETLEEFAALPQSQISHLPEQSANQTSGNSSVEVKSAEETAEQTKTSDIKVCESLEKSKNSIAEIPAPKISPRESRNQSEIIIKSDESGINQSQEKSDVRVVSQKTSRNQGWD